MKKFKLKVLNRTIHKSICTIPNLNKYNFGCKKELGFLNAKLFLGNLNEQQLRFKKDNHKGKHV